MLPPKHPFSQAPARQVLNHGGWCWGLSVRWLVECEATSPSVAGMAIDWSDIYFQAMWCHDTYVRQMQYCDLTLRAVTFNLSARRLVTVRRPLLNTTNIIETVASIIVAMGEGRDFYGLLYIGFAGGAHALSVARVRNVWALFDSEFGTWTFSGRPGLTPPDFWITLADDLMRYMPHEVRLFELERWKEPAHAVDPT